MRLQRLNILDFNRHQLAKFDALATKIQTEPERYLDFESVSDVYKAKWLDDFPHGTTCSCTGLDDGADEFDVRIQYRNRVLKIAVATQVDVVFEILDTIGVFESKDKE